MMPAGTSYLLGWVAQSRERENDTTSSWRRMTIVSQILYFVQTLPPTLPTNTQYSNDIPEHVKSIQRLLCAFVR